MNDDIVRLPLADADKMASVSSCSSGADVSNRSGLEVHPSMD